MHRVFEEKCAKKRRRIFRVFRSKTLVSRATLRIFERANARKRARKRARANARAQTRARKRARAQNALRNAIRDNGEMRNPLVIMTGAPRLGNKHGRAQTRISINCTLLHASAHQKSIEQFSKKHMEGPNHEISDDILNRIALVTGP